MLSTKILINGQVLEMRYPLVKRLKRWLTTAHSCLLLLTSARHSCASKRIVWSDPSGDSLNWLNLEFMTEEVCGVWRCVLCVDYGVHGVHMSGAHLHPLQFNTIQFYTMNYRINRFIFVKSLINFIKIQNIIPLSRTSFLICLFNVNKVS